MPRRLSFFAAIVVLLVSACASGQTNTGATGSPDKVKIATSLAFSSIDPQGPSGSTFWSQIFFGNVVETLTTLDGQTSTVHPDLADSWTSPDSSTLDMKLIQGVKFSNGEAFNADAVVSNFKRILDPNTNTALTASTSNIKGVTAIDASNIQVVTKSPGPATVMLRALAFIPMIAPSQTTSTKEISGAIIGTGPYMIASMDSQTRVLKASPSYRGQAPKPSEVDLVAVPEISSRVAAVQSGDAQIAFDIPSEQVSVVPKVYALPQLEMVNWRLNGLGGLTKDPRVRQALVMGTDVEAIRKALLGDKYSTPCDGNYVPPGVFGWDPNSKRPAYDQAAAKQLLVDAGVTGKTITLISSDTATKSLEASQALAQQIGDLGLKVDLQVKDTQAWLNILIRPNPGSIEIVVQGAGAEQWDALPVFFSAPHQGSGLSTFPPEAVPQFEGALTAAAAEMDDSKRAQDLFDAAKTMRDANAFICGWTAESVYGTQKNLGWTLRRDNRIDFATIHYV